MPFEAKKTKIRKLAKDRVNLDFYNPKPILTKYGWTQNRLAAVLDVSQSSINGIINGNPSISQVKLLADTIGCSFFEFFDLSGMEFKSPVPAITPDAIANKLACPNCGAAFAVSTRVSLTPIDE